jgi:hypothetical protein
MIELGFRHELTLTLQRKGFRRGSSVVVISQATNKHSVKKMKRTTFNLYFFYSCIFWVLSSMFLAYYGGEIGSMLVTNAGELRRIMRRVATSDFMWTIQKLCMGVSGFASLALAWHLWRHPWGHRWYYLGGLWTTCFLGSMIVAYSLLRWHIASLPPPPPPSADAINLRAKLDEKKQKWHPSQKW